MRKEEVKTQWGRDSYAFMSAQEIPGVANENSYFFDAANMSWHGDTKETFLQRIVTGDDRLVEESEQFLSKIEDQVPVSRGWRNIDDVVGAIPNVPAFLAGHPQHMRRRVRVAKETAPLFIYMDLTSSGGIDDRDIRRRGVVLLALTRMLVEHRPVELWVGASLGKWGVSGTVAWRIDTAPLDLARSSYHISATAMSRLFGYRLTQKWFGSGGHWPFADYNLHCRTAEQRLRAVIGFDQLLYIPPLYLGDEMTKDPVGWVRRVMAQYVNTEEEAA